MPKNEKITVAHGSGGYVMAEFIKSTILKNMKFGKMTGEVMLDDLDDASVIDDVVFTTDTYTVRPIFFPGGSIGSLAVSGTINDISVMGAEPVALSCGLVIEEGFEIMKIEKILKDMSETAKRAGVPIITGDTKVMEKGLIKEIIINTSGIGRATASLRKNSRYIMRRGRNVKYLKDSNLKEGDIIIISGTIGDHGIAVLSEREGYDFRTNVKSDAQPLNKMIQRVIDVCGVVAMKDPTRGGVANALNEWSEKSGVGIEIYEKSLPVRKEVRSACDMLGIDPLNIGNEGKVLVAVIEEKALDVLKVMRRSKLGRDAVIIGKARKDVDGVVMKTVIGGWRIVEAPSGDPIPRIC